MKILGGVGKFSPLTISLYRTPTRGAMNHTRGLGYQVIYSGFGVEEGMSGRARRRPRLLVSSYTAKDKHRNIASDPEQVADDGG